jgi:hypothetical protein
LIGYALPWLSEIGDKDTIAMGKTYYLKREMKRKALKPLNFIAYQILVGYNRPSIKSRIFPYTSAHN